MIVAPGEDRSLLHPVRTAVFVGEQGVRPEIEQDELDALAWHSVLPDGSATGRLIDPGGDLALGRVGRMAVAADARGRGLGAVVLGELEAQARRLGLLGIELHAQLHAAGFYRRQGYEAVGETYLEEGIEHVSMEKRWLPGLRPVRDSDAAAVQALVRACWEAYDGVVFDLAEEPWMLAPASARPQARMWVLDDAGAAPGRDIRLSASVAVAGDELKTLYVAAASRRRGLGEALTRLAERAGGRRLWSDVKFLDAHALYERLGWARTGRCRELGDRSATVEWEFSLADAMGGFVPGVS